MRWFNYRFEIHGKIIQLKWFLVPDVMGIFR